MTDKGILRLLERRDENGLAQAESRYGAYMTEISKNITSDGETARECVNRALLALWEATGKDGVGDLRLFLARTVRNVSMNVYRAETSEKRGGKYAHDEPFEELDECLPSGGGVEDEVSARELAAFVGCFVKKLPDAEKTAFTARYFYAAPLSEIARSMSVDEDRVKKLLYRARQKLRKSLEREKWI